MNITYEGFRLRNALPCDVPLLTRWWNDGRIMAHAGFADGLHTNEKEVLEKIKQDNENCRRLIIERNNTAIGEMIYFRKDEDTAEIGIKICDFQKHDKGYGKIVLSMLIQTLFGQMGYKKIVLDTDWNNLRAQHVYEQLGFKKTAIHKDAWKDQQGRMRTNVDYELYPCDFQSYCNIKTRKL